MLARRVFGDGRTRAYAWGRSVAREDLAAAAERLIAMSGQFEQRRLARPAFQLGVLDAFCGPEQLERRREAAAAWRALGAARRLHDELTRDAAGAAARLAELEALVEGDRGSRNRGGGRASRPPGAPAARLRARVGSRGRRCGDRARRGRGRGRARRTRRTRARPDRAARAGARRGSGRAPRRRAAPARGRERPARLPGLSRRRPGAPRGRREQARADLGPEAPVRLRVVRRPARARGGGARGARGGSRRARSGRRGRGSGRCCRDAEWTVSRTRCAPSGARRRNRSPRQSRASFKASAWGRESSSSSSASASSGATGADEAIFLVRPERRASVRPGRRDRVRRRALAHRAGPRRGRRRRDARVRRDRRRDRRCHRARGRIDAPAPGRARAGADDHPSPADRERRRAPLPRREGRRATRRTRASRSSTSSCAARSSSGCWAARSSSQR